MEELFSALEYYELSCLLTVLAGVFGTVRSMGPCTVPGLFRIQLPAAKLRTANINPLRIECYPETGIPVSSLNLPHRKLGPEEDGENAHLTLPSD
ncbi:MAG: hypothetical protein H0Z34_00525 [Brevibacillus sp.]|nr:hypothetical protein [Brevibacillus sp.]